MKHRPSKRVTWLVIPIVPVVLMGGLLWLADRAQEDALATRGALPPPEKTFALKDPATWKHAFKNADGWIGDGRMLLESWQDDPGKGIAKEDDWFLLRFNRLKFSGDAGDRKKHERLTRVGRAWHARILSRFPDLSIDPLKDLPAERNGLLRLTEAIKRHSGENQWHLNEPMPVGIHPFSPDYPWDKEVMKAFVEDNRAFLDEFREIGLMKERSGSGVDLTGWGVHLPAMLIPVGSLILEARVAADEGDMDHALETIRSAYGLCSHVSETEISTFTGWKIAAARRNRIRTYVFEAILPSLPAGRFDPARWEQAMSPPAHQPKDLSRILRAEWNTRMSEELLPALSNADDRGLPSDPDHLVEAYSLHMRGLVAQAEDPEQKEPPSHLSPIVLVRELSQESKDLAPALGISGTIGNAGEWWKQQEAEARLVRVAFAILKGEPPPVDELSGKPFEWNPSIRRLSQPDTAEYRTAGRMAIELPNLQQSP